ncbi:MAG: hypothetical protein WAO02_08140 [Verrucomicrobiia bacterium]
MGINQIILIAAIVLTGLLASGCKPSEPAAPKANTNAVQAVSNAVHVPSPSPAPASARARTRDLGVLQLTNRWETRIQLDADKSCAITPHLIDPTHLQLTMVLESKMPDGKINGLNIIKVVSQPNQQFEFDFDGVSLTVTPQMAGETNPPAKTP